MLCKPILNFAERCESLPRYREAPAFLDPGIPDCEPFPDRPNPPTSEEWSPTVGFQQYVLCVMPDPGFWNSHMHTFPG